jgi:hypothetical protein
MHRRQTLNAGGLPEIMKLPPTFMSTHVGALSYITPTVKSPTPWALPHSINDRVLSIDQLYRLKSDAIIRYRAQRARYRPQVSRPPGT